MSEETTVPEGTPPSDPTDQPEESATETVESLKTRLAAEEKSRLEAEQEAKTWKNRVKEENPPKKKEDESDLYADWRIDNRSRVALVKEQYEKELSELQEGGAKLSVSLREKALRLAESSAGIKKEEKGTEPLPGAMVDRGGSREPIMSEHDLAFGVKAETKKKYPVNW